MKIIEEWCCYHLTYSGMIIPRCKGSYRECMANAGFKVKVARRQGYPVNKLGRSQWEIETPEDAIMIGDFEGYLTVCPERDAPPEAR